MLASALLVSAFSMMPGILMAETSGYWKYDVSSDQVTISDYFGNESHVVIPATLGGKPVVAIGKAAFGENPGVQSITIPASVTSIGTTAFLSCYSLIKYDFSQSIAVPMLSNTNAFTNINKIAKIIVPDSLYDEWIAATNWSTYADYIYKASEVTA